MERKDPEVRFVGYRVGEDLATCYASADLLLFPSETETFGNVLIEGMASGLAIVAYDYAAAAWHGEDGVNVLKVEKSDDSAYLAAAESLLDESLRKKLGAEARLTAESLSWPEIVADLEREFKAVATEDGRV